MSVPSRMPLPRFAIPPPSVARVALAVTALAAAAGCASPPGRLDAWPEREVARARVLPAGVARWRPFLARSLDADAETFLFPLRWEHGLSERITLLWFPVPLHARFGLARDEASEHSLDVALFGPMDSRARDFFWRPFAEWRRRAWWDGGRWDLKAGVQIELQRGNDHNLGRTLIAAAEPGWQLGPVFASLEAALRQEQGETPAFYLGALPPATRGDGAQAPRWRFPLTLSLAWDPSPRWQVAARASWLGIGYPAGTGGVPAYFEVAYAY